MKSFSSAVPDVRAKESLARLNAALTSLIADIHFDYTLALQAIAEGVEGIRFNPGNIGSEESGESPGRCCRSKKCRHPDWELMHGSLKETCEKYGSPTPQAMVDSALRHVGYLKIRLYQSENFPQGLRCFSHGGSAIPAIAQQVDYPLHIGVTEAGTRERRHG